MMMSPYFYLILYGMSVQGLQILDPEEVEYFRSSVSAEVGGSVTLDCGPTLPHIFIWGFTKAGTENNVAVACNYGHGTELQPDWEKLGVVRIHDNTSALVIDDVHADASGMFTCQALYHSDTGAHISFYYARLDLHS